MSSDTMQLAGEFHSCGCIPHSPKLNADWKPKRYRDRRGPEDIYACARLYRKGELVLSGKRAIEHFVWMREQRAKREALEYNYPEETMGDGQRV